jgi:hypothetical protein
MSALRTADRNVCATSRRQECLRYGMKMGEQHGTWGLGGAGSFPGARPEPRCRTGTNACPTGQARMPVLLRATG